MSTCQARVVAAKACKPLPGDAPCQPILEDEDEDEDDDDNVHDDAEGDVKSGNLSYKKEWTQISKYRYQRSSLWQTPMSRENLRL